MGKMFKKEKDQKTMASGYKDIQIKQAALETKRQALMDERKELRTERHDEILMKSDYESRITMLRQKIEDIKDKNSNEYKELKEELRDAQLKVSKSETRIELINQQIEDINNDLKEIDSEYKTTLQALDSYSKDDKNRGDKHCNILGTLFAGAGTGAAIWLGKKSLDKAYEANVEGKLVNKGPLEFLNKLNPLSLIKKIKT